MMTDEWKDSLLITFEPARTRGFWPRLGNPHYKTLKAIRGRERRLLHSRAFVRCAPFDHMQQILQSIPFEVQISAKGS